MPIEVEVPETNSIIEFDDGTPESTIVEQVNRHISATKGGNTAAATPANSTPKVPDTSYPDTSYADRGSKTASNLMDRVVGAANSAMEWAQTPIASPKGTVSGYLKNYPIIQGSVEAAEEAVGGFTSPLNIGIMLGARKLPVAGQRALSAAFAVDMANNSAHQVGAALEAAYRGDYKSASKELTHALLGTGMSRMAYKHAKTEPAMTAPPVSKKLVKGAFEAEKQYQDSLEALRNPPKQEAAVIPPEKAEFYSEGQIAPVEKVAAPKKGNSKPVAPVATSGKVTFPTPKPVDTTTLESTASVTAERLKPVVEQQSKTAEPVAANGYDLYRQRQPELLEAPVVEIPKQHEFSSTQINMPETVAKQVRQAGERLIKETDLVEDGLETEPHVTVKYGLHTDDVAPLKKLLANEPPIKVRVGATSIFPSDKPGKGDVVKFDIDSEDLHRLNAKIAGALENTDTYPDYNPHMTLGYVQPGKGKLYEGKSVDGLTGNEITIDQLTFSPKNGEKVTIPLTGKSEVAQSAKPIKPEDPSIYLGSGVGGLQKLYDRVTNGLTVNNILSKAVQKGQEKSGRFTTESTDYQLPLRDLDEMAGLRMSDSGDLAQSAYVRARLYAGTAGAALYHIIKLNATNVLHRNELRRVGKQEGLSRNERRALFPESMKWRQLVALTEDVPAKLARDTAEWQKKVDEGLIDPTKEAPPSYTFPEGKTVEQLRADRQALEDKVGPQMVKEFKRQADEFRNQQWDYLENILVKPYWAENEGGIMSQDQFNKMKAENPNYISLRRIFDDMQTEDQYYATGEKFKVTGNSVIQNRKEGSTAKLSDPIAETNKDIFRAVSLAMRNSVLHSIVNLRERAPAMKEIIRSTYEGYKPASNEHVMVLRNAGKPNRYVVPRDIAPILERMDKVQMDTMADFIGSMNRTYRNMITTSAKFIAGNTVRDFLTSMTTSAHKHSAGLAFSYLRGMTDSMFRDTKLSNDLYMEFLKNFASGSGPVEWMSRGEGMEQINRINTDLTHPGHWNPAKQALKGWQYFGTTIELGPRMMAFRNALEAQESPIVAGFRARNVSVDFAKHGANKYVNVARQMTPFVGARWQGTKMMLDTIGEGIKALPGVRGLEKYGMKPTRLNKSQQTNLAVSLGSIGMLAAMTQIHNLLFYPEAYAQVDNDEKNNKLFFITNLKDKMGRFKHMGPALLTSEFNFFIEPIRGFITYAYHEYPDQFLEMARKFFPDLEASPVEQKPDLGKTVMNTVNAISPYSFSKNGEFSTRELLSSVVPSPMQAVYAGVFGVNPRTGNPIDQGVTRQADPEFRKDKFTRPSATAASKLLNSLFDATGIDKGAAIRSPRVLQETANLSVGGFPMDLADSAMRSINNTTGKETFEDPSATFGQPTEGVIDAATARFWASRPSTYDSDESRAIQDLKRQHGNHNLELAQAADTVMALRKQGKITESEKYLRNFLQNNIKPDDEAGKHYFVSRLKTLTKIQEANDAIAEYNKTNKANIGELTNTEIALLNESAAIRAQRFLQKLEATQTPTGKQRLLVEWKLKGLINQRVIEALQDEVSKRETSNNTRNTSPQSPQSQLQ